MLQLALLHMQALSQFYLLLLFPSKVQCINRVNGQVRQELPLTPSRALTPGGPSPQALGLASDDAEGTLYLMSGKLPNGLVPSPGRQASCVRLCVQHRLGSVMCKGPNLFMKSVSIEHLPQSP